MGSVLIDNISLSSALEIYLNGNENYKTDITVQNYLFGIVLWDSIFSVGKRMSRNVGDNRIDDLYIDDRFNITVLDFDYGEIDNIASNIVFDMYEDKVAESEFQVIEDTVFYLLLSYNTNMNLLLSKERSEFLIMSKISEKLFNRLNIIDVFEKQLIDYYNEINDKIGKNFITFKCPLLVDFICNNCSNLKDAIDLAKYIRNEKDVIDFRKAMDGLDNALCEGDLISFNEFVSAIPEIVSKITKQGIKSKTVNLGVAISPSITVPFTFEFGKKKRLHLDFLTDLGMYGVYNRFSNVR